jgi:hypothetical protein
MRRSRFSSRLATSSASVGRLAARSRRSSSGISPSSSPSPLTPPPRPPGRKGSPPPPGGNGPKLGERYTRKWMGGDDLATAVSLPSEPPSAVALAPSLACLSSSLMSPESIPEICSTRSRSLEPPWPSPPSSSPSAAAAASRVASASASVSAASTDAEATSPTRASTSASAALVAATNSRTWRIAARRITRKGAPRASFCSSRSKPAACMHGRPPSALATWLRKAGSHRHTERAL